MAPLLTWRTLRRLLIALLLLLVAWLLWRGARLAAVTYAAVEAAQQLQAAAAPAAPAGEAGPAVDVQGLRAGLALLDGRLDALAAELAPLAPALRWVGGLANAGLGAVPGQVATAQQLAGAAAAFGPQLDWLLGMDAPRRYLLLVQNNHELRATGGFISAFGYLVIEEGRIASLDFVDSYELFSLQSEYPPAPAPMEQFMGIQLLVARDANWSPDLPTAAAEIARLYTQDSGRAVDGILTLDLHAVQRLVGALGSLRVPGVGAPLTAGNLEAELVRLWEQPPAAAENGEENGGVGGDWWSRRKDFVPLVAGAIVERIQGGAVDAPALSLAISGSGDIALGRGRCGTAKFSTSGSGDISAGGVQCETLTVSISGSGDVAAQATGTATLRTSGSGDISVTGGARCTSRSSGSGTISCG